MRFQDYITEKVNQKELIDKVIDVHGLPPQGISVVNSKIIKDEKYDWWVILIYHKTLKKYFGLTSDGEMLEDKNKTKSLKWFENQ